MKNQFSVLIILISVFSFQVILSQVSSDLRPAVKSPEVNKFEHYLNMPVNLNSGTPQVNIPIYNLEYNGMSLPISLEYDASGVKVEDIASSVGLKWSLNVGGVVSRIIKGSPDEGNPYAYGATSLVNIDGYYQDKGLSMLESELNKNSESGTWYEGKSNVFHKHFLEFLGSGLKDSQPDLFYFSTPEGGSKFVFNDKQEVVYLENTDFLVEENFSANNFKSWNVTSPSGIKYKFGLDTGGDLGVNNYVEKSCIAGEGDFSNKYLVNSWFLSEISNYTSDQKIVFSYIDNGYSHIINSLETKNTIPCYENMALNYQNCDSGASQYNAYVTGNAGSTTANKVQSKLISKIKAGGTEINFIYGDRDDLLPYQSITPKRLNEIQVVQDGQCIKKFKFNYSVTVSGDFTSGMTAAMRLASRKRLVLDSFVESSCDGTVLKPYVFSYNTQALPNRLSYAQDKWGYYNGNNSNPSLFPYYLYFNYSNRFANRGVNFSFAKAGSLEKITYPTKGTVSFLYEAHQSNIATDYIFNPTVLSTIAYLQPEPPINQFDDGISFKSSTFTYNVPAGEALQLKTQLYYPHPMVGTVTYCGTSSGSSIAVEIVDNVTNARVYLITYGELPSTSPSGIEIVRPLDPSLFVSGRSYSLNVYGAGPRGKCNHNMTYLTRHAITPVYDVGGMRIQTITHKDFDGTVAKTMNYTYSEPSVISNPKTFYKVNYKLEDCYNSLFGILSSTNVNYLRSKVLSDSQAYALSRGYYYNLSTGIDPLSIYFMGPSISYGSVEESDGNGKTKHVFNRYKSYNELNGYAEPAFLPAPPKMQTIMGGEKLSVIQTDINGVGVKSNFYEHTYSITNTTVVGIVSSNLTIMDGALGYLTPFYTYTLQGQLKTLKTETETSGFGGTSVTTKMEYEYRADNKHFQPVKITATDGKGSQSLIVKKYYPTELSTEPLMTNLIAQNRKLPSIREETYNGTTKLSEQRTVYANDATTSSLVLPKNVYAAKFPNTLPVLTTPNVGQLEKKVTSDKYDTNGTLLQFTPESGSPVTIIWGYNKTQPIAKIENATYASIPAATITNLQTLSNTSNNEANLLNALTALRTSLPNNLITTYTYIPSLGVSTVTDPKGYTMYYYYDVLGRLEFVKDADKNILSKNEYHYKN